MILKNIFNRKKTTYKQNRSVIRTGFILAIVVWLINYLNQIN